MKVYTSEHKHTLDPKGRLTVPAKLRAFLGETCFVVRGYEGSLEVYSEEGFEDYSKEILSRSNNTRDIRQLKRALFSKTAQLTYDKQGRILIPKELRDIGNLSKDVMIVGAGDHAELWDYQTWNDYDSLSDDDLADLVERVMNDGNKE